MSVDLPYLHVLQRLLIPKLVAAQVFDVFRDNEVSVDVVATSEISVSLTLDPRYVRPHTSQKGGADGFFWSAYRVCRNAATSFGTN